MHPYSLALLSAVPQVSVGKKVERIVLQGDVPSPINPGVGCRFAPRCWMASERCKTESPKLTEVEPGHFVSCFYADKASANSSLAKKIKGVKKMIDVSMDKRVMPALKIPESQIRKLDITDTERIERFRTAGYGGNVSDALWALGICNTVLSQQFKALRQGMVLVGRALPVKLHTVVIDSSLGPGGESSSYVEDKLNGTEHPQKRMMRCVAESEPGSILCFDCGGDMQPAHFGEMSCQLAYSHGCRGMLIAGNCRDTQYVLKMPDFPCSHLARLLTPLADGL